MGGGEVDQLSLEMRFCNGKGSLIELVLAFKICWASSLFPSLDTPHAHAIHPCSQVSVGLFLLHPPIPTPPLPLLFTLDARPCTFAFSSFWFFGLFIIFFTHTDTVAHTDTDTDTDTHRHRHTHKHTCAWRTLQRARSEVVIVRNHIGGCHALHAPLTVANHHLQQSMVNVAGL